MKNKKCPERKYCFYYKDNNCDGCSFGDCIIKLNKRIDRLKKQNETLTIQRNACALIAKAVKADTVQKMAARLRDLFPCDKKYTTVSRVTIDQITKEILEGNDESSNGVQHNY